MAKLVDLYGKSRCRGIVHLEGHKSWWISFDHKPSNEVGRNLLRIFCVCYGTSVTQGAEGECEGLSPCIRIVMS